MEERGFGGKPWFSSESFTGLRAAEWQPEPKASAALFAHDAVAEDADPFDLA